MLIEQAIFTSAQSDHAVGYHLVARSPGLEEADARELTVWGPSHDSLESASASTAASVNFFRLPSGAFCVSKTQMAGQEYSGRGLRTYTNYLVVSPQVLLRFANNPFALLRAAWAKGLLKVCDVTPHQLVPFQLAGRAAPVDEGLIGQLVAQCGPPIVGRLIEAVLENKPVVLINVRKAEATVAGLLNMLPLSCRRELSFTTGLRYSARRPFHLMIAAQESTELKRWNRQGVVTVVDMVPQSVPVSGKIVSGWGGYVCDLLERDALPTLVAQLIERQEGLRLENLNELGEHLRHQSPASTPAKCNRAAEHPHRDKSVRHRGDRPGSPQPVGDVGTPEDDFLAMLLSGQPASDDVQSNGEPALPVLADDDDSPGPVHLGKLANKRQAPSVLMDVESPAALERLEKLDDVVFDAINGDDRALEEVTRLWPQLAAELGPEKVEESREQYLRYSLAIWESCLEEGLRDPERAVASLQVLSVLFSDH